MNTIQLLRDVLSEANKELCAYLANSSFSVLHSSLDKLIYLSFFLLVCRRVSDCPFSRADSLSTTRFSILRRISSGSSASVTMRRSTTVRTCISLMTIGISLIRLTSLSGCKSTQLFPSPVCSFLIPKYSTTSRSEKRRHTAMPPKAYRFRPTTL